MGCALWRQSATNDSVATAHEADSNSSPPERRSSSPYDGSVGISDLVAPSVTHSVIDFDVSSSTSSATSTPVSGPRQSRSVDDRSQQSARSRDHADPTLSASSSRRGTRRNDERVMKSCFYPGPKSPDSPEMLTNDASVLVTSKRIQTYQGMLDGLKEKKVEMANVNCKSQTAQEAASIILVSVFHNSVAINATSPVPGASVTAKDAKNNHTASEQNIPPLLVPIQNSSSRNSTDRGDALETFDTADGNSEHIERSNALQSSNCVTKPNAKPKVVCNTASESSGHTVGFTVAPLEPEHWVNFGDTKTSSTQAPISPACSSLEDFEHDFGTLTQKGPLRLDESYLHQLEAEGKGTSQLLTPRGDVGAIAATTVHYSRLNSAGNVKDNDPGACSQKLTAADVSSGAQPLAFPNILRRSQHLVRLLSGRRNSASSSSSHSKMPWPPDLRDSNMDDEQEPRLFDKKDNASESGMSSSSELYSQFGDLMNDTGQQGSTYKMPSSYRESPIRLHSNNGDTSETASCSRNECAPQYLANESSVNLIQLENDSRQAENIIASASSSSTVEPIGKRPRFYKIMPKHPCASFRCDRNEKIKSALYKGSSTAASFFGAHRISTSLKTHRAPSIGPGNAPIPCNKSASKVITVAVAQKSSDVVGLQMTAGRDD
eukprot:GEMP01006424.1.p1 GENE.GEMP01006424.1~~GEMP01006424.1.p1  ORF type:complete len:661 (+),score=112.08 GEMP01006424.1:288-2270(+)